MRWYLIIILFAKTVSAEEAVYYKTAYNDGDCGLTEEQKKAFCDKVQGIVNFTSKLNSDITEKITDIANQAGKIEIDIDDKDK